MITKWKHLLGQFSLPPFPEYYQYFENIIFTPFKKSENLYYDESVPPFFHGIYSIFTEKLIERQICFLGLRLTCLSSQQYCYVELPFLPSKYNIENKSIFPSYKFHIRRETPWKTNMSSRKPFKSTIHSQFHIQGVSWHSVWTPRNLDNFQAL